MSFTFNPAVHGRQDAPDRSFAHSMWTLNGPRQCIRQFGDLGKVCYKERTLNKRQRLTVKADSATQENQQSSGAFTAMYERETPLVSLLLEEIDKEGLVYTDTTGEYGGTEKLAEEKRQVIRAVVEKYYEDMSQGLLMVLAGYAQAAYSKRQRHVAETLEMIREEALKVSLEQLPLEMKLLDELITMIPEKREERVKLIKEISIEQAPEGGLPASLGSLRSTATQMLEDMESHEVIMDRKLVAKLCLIREEIDEAAQDLHQMHTGSDYYDMMSASFRLLPMGNAAYIKEILGIGSPEKRKALLEACFKDDFQKSEKESQLMKKWRQQGVRPGRLMNTVKALLIALAEKGISPESPEVKRLLDIREVAIGILNSLKD